MGLDIVLFRADQGGNPELIRESQRKRFAPVELVDKVIDLDARWRKGTSSPFSRH
jgi:seryl-tRNA synthetase